MPPSLGRRISIGTAFKDANCADHGLSRLVLVRSGTRDSRSCCRPQHYTGVGEDCEGAESKAICESLWLPADY